MLNQALYDLLKSKFGYVRVSNPNEAMIGEYKINPTTNDPYFEIKSWGEMYAVDCCYCRDSRQRLCINHRYGIWDEVTKSYNTVLAKCFNEECLKADTSLYKELYIKIYGMMNQEQRKSVSYLGSSVVPPPDAGKLVEVEAPGELEYIHKGTSRLTDEPWFFLSDRADDVVELCKRWSLMYCREAKPQYKLAQDRIIIPIIQEKKWVGWQARYVGDIDWKTSKVPKYYCMPSLPKRLILYNLDVAIEQDFVVITEGPTSCWSVWPHGVALLGKQATVQQRNLIIKNWAEKPVVILLDGDAKADSTRLFNQIKPYCKAGIVNAELPRDRDPGSYSKDVDELWELITFQAKASSVELKI